MKITYILFFGFLGLFLQSCVGDETENDNPQTAEAPEQIEVPKDTILPAQIIKPESPLLFVKEDKIKLVDGTEIEIPLVGDTTAAVAFFVNHGEKEDEMSDRDGLTVNGRLQASRLANVMKESGLKALYWTTNAEMQTGSFTANTVECRSLLYPPETSHLLMKHLVDNEQGNRILIIGDHFAIPEMLNRLTKKDYFRFVPETNFDKFYMAIIKSDTDITVYDMSCYAIN